MRHAFKLFYDGRQFHGSQMQPKVRTVEGELRKALTDLEIPFERLKFASRTDKDVSALGNCIAFSTDSKHIEPRTLNSRLPEDIRILAMKRVDEDFDPRHSAEEKTYRYFLPSAGLDIRELSAALDIIKGEHSFHNFAILDGKAPVRTLNQAEISVDGSAAALTFRSRGFLWQQIRRLVTALVRVGRGELKAAELKRYFDPDYEKKMPPSTGENLILWDIQYNFQFDSEEYSTRGLISRLKERRDRLLVESEMDSRVIDVLERST